MIFFLARVEACFCVRVWISRVRKYTHTLLSHHSLLLSLSLFFHLGEIVFTRKDRRIRTNERTNERTRRGAKETFESAARIIKKKKREERVDAALRVDPYRRTTRASRFKKKNSPRIKKRERGGREEKNEKSQTAREEIVPSPALLRTARSSRAIPSVYPTSFF